jgi:uncharacterized protein with NRDE domain
VCLLVVAWQIIPGTPVLIGANRDELLERPTTLMTALRPAGPRILGGRDEQSGGTWLAVNEHGVFAALTNQPLGDAKDATRRSRGELPLALASQPSATEAASLLLSDYRPADYNGSWLLVGDRSTLFFIDFTGQVEPAAIALAPGIHVLENRPLGAPSPKVARVLELLGVLPADADAATTALESALADHLVPQSDVDADGPRLVPCCVHLETYGTRSSCIVRIGDEPEPQIRVADGPPCTAPFVDASAWWRGDAL